MVGKITSSLSDTLSLTCSWDTQALYFKGIWELGFGVWRKIWSGGVDWGCLQIWRGSVKPLAHRSWPREVR